MIIFELFVLHIKLKFMTRSSWYISWKFIQLLYFSNTAQILSKAVGDQITLIYALYYLGFNTSHSNYDGLIQYKLVTSLKLESHKNFTIIQINYCTQRCKY